MKNLYLSFLLIIFLCNSAAAQPEDLPATLTFSSDDPDNWNDGIANSGEGGAVTINGLNIEIYTASADHTTLFPGSTIVWYDNDYYFSNNDSYTAITSGPDLIASADGVPAMVIRSFDNSVNFSLQGIQLYDWGYFNVITIETYDNGVIVGSVDFTPNPQPVPLTVSQSDLLNPAYFSNIDEVRFFPKSPNTVFNLSMNNISLAEAFVTLPVTFRSIRAKQQNKDIVVEWKVENEDGIKKYDIEKSGDGRVFAGIATQIATGATSANTYQWLDQKVLAGNNFYRIKSIDANGKEAYSSIIKMYSGNATPALLIYPTPATAGFIHLQMNNMPKGIYRLNLFNTAGQVMLTRSINHAAGSSSEMLNFSNLTKGRYLLQVVHPDHSKTLSTIVY